MDKEEVLKQLFQLPKDEILDIFEIIKGYKERVNKSCKDTLLMRSVFMRGYHSSKEFYTVNNLTKDNMLANALNYETINVKAYLKLKELLNIDDEIFRKILLQLKEVE